ncbi:MAG: hypothetical protein K5651_04820 [Bacteroidales bacterium]|nr:hypothetical protein [Bacteroidales bacterium]
MKRYSFIAILALCGCFSACQKSNINQSSQLIDITVSTSLEEMENAKTYLGADNTVLWGENEQMFLSVISDNELIGYAESTQTSAFDGQAQATFSFSVSVPARTYYTYAGVYPASAMGSGNVDPTNVNISLPENQSIPSRGGV